MNTKRQRILPCTAVLILLVFDIFYWHVNFHDLNPTEEILNITKRRYESLLNNKFSPLSPSVNQS